MSDTHWSLHLGDSLLWLPSLPSESADLLLTDPPFSSGGRFRGDRAVGSVDKYINGESQARLQYPEFFGDTRDQRSMLAWCSLWLAECWRILRDGATVALFADWRQTPLMSDALQAGGFVWRGIIAWDKTEAARTVAAGWPRHQCEYILWGTKGPLPERPAGTGLSLPGCLRYPVPRDKIHATEKPMQLLIDLMNLAPEAGSVLDPFVGSGSTGVAALRTGRKFVGAELSDEYCSLARSRLTAEETSQGLRSAQAGQLSLLGGSRV